MEHPFNPSNTVKVPTKFCLPPSNSLLEVSPTVGDGDDGDADSVGLVMVM